MSTSYFENFPLINYQGKVTRNLISRARFIQSVISNYYAFYPYVISDGQTWEQIAHAYYSDANLDWLCYFSNNVFDPYYEFPLNQEAFDDYIYKKYGDFETATNTVHHYKYNSIVENYVDVNLSYTYDYQMTTTTYSFLTPVQQSSWKPVSCYDWENDLNEKKRTIQLLDNRLLDQVLKEIGEIMK